MTKPRKARCRGLRNPTKVGMFPSLTFGFTYSDLHREFHHKNKPLPAFLWCHWSLCLLDLPTPLWVQEPAPGKENLIIEFKVLCSSSSQIWNWPEGSTHPTKYLKKSIICFAMYFVWGRIINVIQSLTNPLRRKVCDPTNLKGHRAPACHAPEGLHRAGPRDWGVFWSCYYLNSIPGKKTLEQGVTLLITTLTILWAFTISGSIKCLLCIILT